MDEPHNARQYRVFNRMPKSVPPFDSAFVNLGHKEGLNVLLKAAPESCLLTCISDGTRAAYALRQIYKRKFKLCGTGIELNLSDLSFSGRVVFFFARGLDHVPHTSPFFCRGPTMVYELAHSQGNVIDMFALGLRYHERLKESGYKGKSLVFVEE